jgi:hypothetical protein
MIFPGFIEIDTPFGKIRLKYIIRPNSEPGCSIRSSADGRLACGLMSGLISGLMHQVSKNNRL